MASPAQPGPSSFESEALAVMGDLRALMSTVLEAKCGPDPAVTDISSAFGIHRKLAWQLSRVAYDEDPFLAARHMPTARSLSALLRAASDRAVDPAALASIARASEAFEALVREHAGDRASFDLMLGACSAATDDDEAARWRQQAFTGAGFIWGAHCRAISAIAVQFPSADRPGYFDMAIVRGLIGFRLNRPHTYWLLGQSAVLKDDASPRDAAREPLDPDAARASAGVPILSAHCAGELPAFERRAAASGLIDDLLVPAPVGLRGERTIYTGEVIRRLAPAHATPDDRVAHFGVGVRTPAETLVLDHFTHRDLFPGVQRELCVFSDLHAPVAFSESDRLPIPARLHDLGAGLDRAQCREVPGYARLLRDVFRRLAQDPADFTLHRARVAYPPMPASVMIRHGLPEPPAHARTRKGR